MDVEQSLFAGLAADLIDRLPGRRRSCAGQRRDDRERDAFGPGSFRDGRGLEGRRACSAGPD